MARSAVCFEIRSGIRVGSARSACRVSICFLAWLENASKTREPILGRRVGSSSGKGGLPLDVASDAAAAIPGKMSVVI